ncbi:MAG: C69 family dipeptidase, partial [Bacteroidales bacterium]
AYDVVDYAKNIGLFAGNFEDFSFSDTYAPIDFGAARGCEARVWSGFMQANRAEMAKYEKYARGEDLSMRMPLWITPDRKLGLEDVMNMMRDHYEGTSMDMTKDLGAGPFQCPYRWRPMGFEVDGKGYVHERAISTQQTGFSFVTQSRSWLPNPIGGILWFGVDDTYSTCYTPMYCGITQIPECFKVGNGNMITYSPTSAFWLFNQVTNFTYLRYNDIIKDVISVQKELETSFIKKVALNDAAWGKETDMKKLVNQANTFSNAQASIVFARWKKLSEYLLVKYIDGNIKKEENGKFKNSKYGEQRAVMPSQPKYPDWWYKKIVEDAGENLKVITPAK